MDEKILLKYQRRIDDFLTSVSDNLVYRDYIPLTVEAAITPEAVPFKDRLSLEYHPVHERESWGYDWASAWFHITAEVPEEFAGKELCLRFHVGGEALVFDENGVPVYGLTGYSVFDELYCKERMVIGSNFPILIHLGQRSSLEHLENEYCMVSRNRASTLGNDIGVRNAVLVGGIDHCVYGIVHILLN